MKRKFKNEISKYSNSIQLPIKFELLKKFLEKSYYKSHLVILSLDYAADIC